MKDFIRFIFNVVSSNIYRSIVQALIMIETLHRGRISIVLGYVQTLLSQMKMQLGGTMETLISNHSTVGSNGAEGRCSIRKFIKPEFQGYSLEKMDEILVK